MVPRTFYAFQLIDSGSMDDDMQMCASARPARLYVMRACKFNCQWLNWASVHRSMMRMMMNIDELVQKQNMMAALMTECGAPQGEDADECMLGTTMKMMEKKR